MGEAPGAREDFEGAPFIGRSGKLLDAMLADAGFEPGDVRFTNAIRCRPPGNRDPYPDEIDACREHLRDEIALVKPEVIVALGNGALRSLTKLYGIKSRRGQALKLHADFGMGDAEIVYPVYHPAYVLRQPMARNVVVSDLRRVRDRTKEPDVVPWTWWDGQPLPDGPCGFDIETDYDRKTRTGGQNITQVAVAFFDQVFVATGEQAHELARQLIGREQVFTLNGWDFDNPRCHALSLLVPQGIDVMAMAYLDDETQSLGLESLAVKYLQVRGWKDERDAPLGSPEYALYNARDAWYTLRLAAHLYRVLGDSALGVPRARLITDVMGPARLALDACTARGLPIAAQPVSVARAAFDLQLETQLGRVRALAGEGHNPNATRQVADELKRRGFELPLTKTGQAQVDKRILKELAHGDEYAAAMLGYREAQKKLSTYVRPYEEILRDDGRAHSRYTIWRTVTNRTSSSGPNVQNLDRALKDFFDAVSYDYKAIEFRIAAWLAGETSILTRYAEDADWDPHRFFASHLYGKHEEAVTKNERQVAKSANFALLYLGNGQTLYEYCRKQGILLSRAECDKIYRVWHRTFPGFARFYKQTLTELERDGYVESATGYRRHFGDFSLLRGEARREALRQAVNMKVQTLACHVALIGLAACWRRDLPVCGFIHDAVLFDMPGSTALAKHDEIRYALTVEPIEVLKDRFNITLDVPLVVESNLED